MKVKELKDNELVGTKVKIPKEFEDKYMGVFGEMFLYGSWQQGIWFKKSMKEERIYPLCINPQEVLEWEIV